MTRLAAIILTLLALTGAPQSAMAAALRPGKTASGNFSSSPTLHAPRDTPQTLDLAGRNEAHDYETASGRPKWISRDPIEEKGGVNVNAYVQNHTLNSIDHLGYEELLLLPMPTLQIVDVVRKIDVVWPTVDGKQEFWVGGRDSRAISRQPRDPCWNACELAKQQNLHLVNGNPSVAGVVCCNGLKYRCIWASGAIPGGTATDITAIKIIDHCARIHEGDHFDDIDCPPQNSSNQNVVTRPPFRDPSPANINRQECEAYIAERDCIRAKIGECRTTQCRTEVNADLAGVQRQINALCVGNKR